METSFLSIFLDAAMQVANLADSQVLILFESSEGCRRIGGDDSMLADFQAGQLLPRATDKLFEKAGKSIPLRTSVMPGTDFDQRASQERQKEADSANQSSNYIFNGQEPALLKKRRQNSDDAATTDVTIKRLKKGNETRFKKIDKGGEATVDENNRLESRVLKLDVENEEDLMLHHDVDDDNHDEIARDGASNCLKENAFVNKSWNINDDAIDDGDDENVDGPAVDENDKPVIEKEWNDGNINDSAINGPTASLEVEKKERNVKMHGVVKRRCGLCPASNTRTYTQKAYQKHKAGQHDKKLSCSHCQKGFSSNYYLKRHIMESCPLLQRQKDVSTQSDDPTDLELPKADSSI